MSCSADDGSEATIASQGIPRYPGIMQPVLSSRSEASGKANSFLHTILEHHRYDRVCSAVVIQDDGIA